MARPLKKGFDYFPHDTDMSEDEKLQKVEFKFGLEGYAIYNKILERSFKTSGDFSLSDDDGYKMYAEKWRIEVERLKEIIMFFRDLKLFPEENFVSNGIKKRMRKIKQERDRKRKYYKTKEVTARVSDGRNTGEIPVSPNKVNKTKLNKTKENNKDIDIEGHVTVTSRQDLGKLQIYWNTILFTPRLIEKEFIDNLYGKFGLDKSKGIIRDLAENGFKKVKTMRESLNWETGEIKPKNTEPEGITIKKVD